MGKSIVIIGDTAAGKSSVLKELEAWGFDRVVPYTTRPMRSEEFNSNEYRQVSDDTFNSMQCRGDFAEWATYNTHFGKWQYGILKREVQSRFKWRHNALIVNPKSLDMLNEFDLFVVHLKVPKDVLLKRLEKRGDAESEYMRRLNDDAMYFTKAHYDGKIDMVVEYNEQHTPKDIVRLIVSEFKRHI